MAKERTRAEYLKHFAGESLAKSRQVEALRTAHDIRKFEIELYWKRAAYFWTFIAAAFAGFFALQQQSGVSSESTYIVACLGLVFSLAWYLVNRGSKSWQRNWEAQVDLLEDEVTGPLYKSEIDRYSSSLLDVTGGYHFSPSKINQLLGLLVTFVWLGLSVRTYLLGDWSQLSSSWTVRGTTGLTVLACASFWFFGRSSEAKEPRVRIKHSLRTHSESMGTPNEQE